MMNANSIRSILMGLFLLPASLNAFAQKEQFCDYDAWHQVVMKNYMQFLDESQNKGGKMAVDAMRIDNLVKAPQFPALRKKALSAVDIKKLCKPSSLQVCGFKSTAANKNGWEIWPVATATVLSADGVCVTNYHVLFDFVLSGLVGDELPDNNQRFLTDAEGRVYPITEVMAADPVNDFAIFRVDTQGDKLTPVPMRVGVEEGETVYCLGHPRDLPYFFSQGIVSRNISFVNQNNGHRKYETQITADFGVGASGGPVLDNRGNLIGIVGATFTMYADQQARKNFQMTIKKAVPVFLIQDCFAAANKMPAVARTEAPAFEAKEGVPDTATVAVHYHMTHLYNPESKLTYSEDRLVWASGKSSLDVGIVPKDLKKGQRPHLTPNYYYYDGESKTLTRTYQLLSLELLTDQQKNEVEWTIDPDDVKMMNGYFCQKATCEKGGRRWTAWFTDEISAIAAPRHLTGLPGVIVEVQDEKAEVKWEMLGLEPLPAVQGGFSLQIPSSVTPVPQSNFQLVKKYFGLSPMDYVRETFFGRNGAVPPGIMFPSTGIDACKVTNPIEK